MRQIIMSVFLFTVCNALFGQKMIWADPRAVTDLGRNELIHCAWQGIQNAMTDDSNNFEDGSISGFGIQLSIGGYFNNQRLEPKRWKIYEASDCEEDKADACIITETEYEYRGSIEYNHYHYPVYPGCSGYGVGSEGLLSSNFNFYATLDEFQLINENIGNVIPFISRDLRKKPTELPISFFKTETGCLNFLREGHHRTNDDGSSICEAHCICEFDGPFLREKRLRYTRVINFSDKLFERGYLNMDPSQSVLWHTDWKPDIDGYNLYFCYATNIIEAIQFVLLHEYAHMLGNNEQQASEFARYRMIEIRRSKSKLPYYLTLLENDLREAIKESSLINHAFIHEGSPPSGRLPSGMIRR